MPKPVFTKHVTIAGSSVDLNELNPEPGVIVHLPGARGVDLCFRLGDDLVFAQVTVLNRPGKKKVQSFLNALPSRLNFVAWFVSLDSVADGAYLNDDHLIITDGDGLKPVLGDDVLERLRWVHSQIN